MKNPKPKSRIVKRVWRLGARLDVAAVVIFVVLLLAVLGSCFPQRSALIAASPGRLAPWEAAVRAKYGALAGLLDGLGVFQFFHSPLFLFLLMLLVLVALVCTFQRWRRVWRRVFHQLVRCSDTVFDAAPHAAEVAALPKADLPSIVRRSLERCGFRVRFETAEGIVYLRGDRHRLAPLATLVTHLAVLLLALGAALSGLYGWREEVVVGPGEVTAVNHIGGLGLRNEGFTITRYPDGSAASYTADVAIVEAGQDAARGRVQLNEPLSHGGVSFVLHSYTGTEGRYSVTLLAVYDPGYGLFVVAGFLLLFGPTVSFNFPHCWIHARVDSEGGLRLAGRADRRAWGFEREFAALVEEIGRQ